MIPGGIKKNQRELVGQVREWVEQCNVSVGMRKAYYRLMNAIAETGRYDGTKALINMLNVHLKRTSAHLFSPVELKFTLDFDRPYPNNIYKQSAEVGKQVTRTWERNGTGNRFGNGVFESLKYGACFTKQWTSVEGQWSEGDDDTPVYHDKLVMPWNLGVYREDENSLDLQPVICETSTLTLPEVWQRIWRFPDAEKLFNRIKTHASEGAASEEPNSFFHNVLSTSQINTGVQSMTQPVPGGIVQLNSDPNYALMGPVVAPNVVQMRELWVQDETDYTTIQLIEPDVLISPRFMGDVMMKKNNAFIPGSRLHPYNIIQPNEVEGWIWGRSELVDLIEPQQLLSAWCDDARRMISLQIDKILGFSGEAGMTDEIYAQARLAGYMNLGPNGKVEDLTPSLPNELLPMLKWLQEQINILGGFPPIMQGQGEQGVRAGSHATTLMKTASPSLRDRALLVEQQCAAAADKTLTLKEAKDPTRYWYKADKIPADIEETSFMISDLPTDWRVSVDSHSSSPIFSDENTQLVLAAKKDGIVDGEYVIDNTPLPNKEVAKQAFREHAKQQQELMQKLLQSDPEAGKKLLEKQLGGGKHR